MSMSGWMAMRSLTRDDSVKDRKLAPGTARRVAAYGKPFRREILLFVVLVVIDSALVVATPLLLKELIDRGITPRDRGVVVELSLIVAALAIGDGVLSLVERWYSARIGEGLIYALRTQVFSHVLQQPIAFFTRAQTGALVSRLNSDVLGAQQAFTSVLSSVVSNVVSLALIIATMASLSWQLTLAVARPRAVLPHPGALHGSPPGRSHARPDGAQRRHGHAHDRALQRRRGLAGQGVRRRPPRGRGVCRPRGRRARHGRADRPEPRRLLRRADPGGLARDRHGLRVRRPDGRERAADRRHAAGADRPARPASTARSPRCPTCAST